jgi:predicted CoA-substrate-specific enzyme activase
MADLFLGIDVGSTTVKVVAVDRSQELLGWRYLRANGRPRQTVVQGVLSLEESLGPLGFGVGLEPLVGALGPGGRPVHRVVSVGFTGSGGETVAHLAGGNHTNELVAQCRSIGRYHPSARTIIEIGGQDSKFMSVRWDPGVDRMVLVDFAMNNLCAAGTGSFLDQQAERLGLSIEDEFAKIAMRSQAPARVAGRCTVFAKSDMIHLQQRGTPLPDILAGLCAALARNFQTVIGKKKAFLPPIVFQGGVAFNPAVVRAFETTLDLEPGQLIVPEHHAVMAALGAAFVAMDEADEGGLPAFGGFTPVIEAIRSKRTGARTMPPLARGGVGSTPEATPAPIRRTPMPVYLGLDVGSISTNLVLLDEAGEVVARRYLMTGGEPIEAVRRGLREIGDEFGPRVAVVGAAATGSGRYLTGDFVGADMIRNEITAQSRAAVEADPGVDTVFEIGGQDSKFIRLQDGAVVDFAMNSACAAGTGSFLQEQADKLHIDIAKDFSHLALSSAAPVCLGERCTVFMESDLVHHQQEGAGVEDLTAGLAYSIAQNYLNRVVNGRPLGVNLLFQGGVAWNESVVAAFVAITGRRVRVPPHHDVTGAIGAALLVRDELRLQKEDGLSPAPSRFRGFDLVDRSYDATMVICRACPNLCEVNRVVLEGQPPIFYGARCDKFEEAGRQTTFGDWPVPDLFAERERLLLGGFAPADGSGRPDATPPGAVPERLGEGGRNGKRRGALRIGIPRSLVFWDLFPYWRTFFADLEMEVVLSAPTTSRTIQRTQETAVAETCFPVRVVWGHVADLLERDVDLLFLPSIVNREDPAPGQVHAKYCSYVPAAGQMLAAHFDDCGNGPRVIRPPLHMGWPEAFKRELRALGRDLGVSRRRVDRAAKRAWNAQRRFYAALRERGREVLAGLEPGQPAVVLVGRTYNTCDSGICLDLPLKLRRLGVLAIPMDLLSLEGIDTSDVNDNMYWWGGQRILAAGRIIARDPRLHAVYVTNFGCGPDSFLLSFLRTLMDPKPVLELEIDDHTADAGALTRCEAFLDSLGFRRRVKA